MRKLKIYSLFQQRTWKSIIVPQIRLQGKYLHEAGFAAGQEINVKVSKGKIIIEKA
jgi:toxic protein SymE